MSELLFEGYNVPSVSYGVDSLFSFYNNNPTSTADGLVVSSGTSSTHVIPMLNGQSVMTSAKKRVEAGERELDLAQTQADLVFPCLSSTSIRLGWGGAQASDLMLKLMQLKYPTFPGRLTPYQAGVSRAPRCQFPTNAARAD